MESPEDPQKIRNFSHSLSFPLELEKSLEIDGGSQQQDLRTSSKGRIEPNCWIKFQMDVLTNAANFFADHPLLVLALAFLVFRFWQSRQPLEEVPGSKVRSVSSMEELRAIQEEAKQSNSKVLVDFYATWCPPCRAASKPLSEMSKLYENVVFAKVDVDKARDVASQFQITAMPTFKLLNQAGNEIGSLRGWRESDLRNMIVDSLNK